MSKDKTRPSRTPIWAEGRQHPPFEPRAFARASLIFGRASLAGLLSRCAGSAVAFGAEVASGRWRVPPARLGRSGRYLPDYRRVAGAISGAGSLLGRSARVVLPGDAPPAPASIFDTPARDVAPPPAPPAAERRPPLLTLVETHPAAAPAPGLEPVAAREATGADVGPGGILPDPSLAAIRLVMGASRGEAMPPRPQAAPLAWGRGAALACAVLSGEADPAADAAAPPPAVQPTRLPTRQPGRLRAHLAEAAARGLGYGLLALSLPWGAIRATVAHLNGEDLRKLDA